jgi:hypothetical protein
MPGDPKQCRLHALHGIEMAATVKTPQMKATLLDLSKSWVRRSDGEVLGLLEKGLGCTVVRLAESLEQNHALMVDLSRFPPLAHCGFENEGAPA